MPLYEYECESCGNRFELIQRFSDPPPDCCPSCRGAVRKLLSSPAIQFKGSGWYVTDYARKPSEAGKASGDSKDSKASSSSDSSAKSPAATPSGGTSSSDS